MTTINQLVKYNNLNQERPRPDFGMFEIEGESSCRRVMLL